MKRILTTILFAFTLSVPDNGTYAKDIPYTQEDRDRLIRVETKLEAIDKRFDAIDRRFDDMNKRFEDMNAQANRMSAIFTALVVAVIGFALWDRRTMVRPFEDKVKKIEEDIAGNRTTLHSLLESLRTLSKKDTELAEILRRFNLL